MGLNWSNIWFAFYALLGFVMIAPALYFWVLPTFFYGQEQHVTFLATMVPPMLVILMIAGWLTPG